MGFHLDRNQWGQGQCGRRGHMSRGEEQSVEGSGRRAGLQRWGEGSSELSGRLGPMQEALPLRAMI